MKTIQQHLQEMLKENTGSHFLDSGGAYGRNWERNQERDFESEPRVSIEYGSDGDFWSYSVSLYHYLKEALSVDETSEKINKMLNAQRRKARKQDEKLRDQDRWSELDSINWVHWVGECAEFLEENEHKIGELSFGEQWNSCNGESNLSQVITGIEFEVYPEGKYILLQIHGGCDVRGGYTDARCFKVDAEYFMTNVDVYGSIEKDGENIQVDNMYNGYSLTDEDGNEVEIKKENNLELDFYVSTF